MKLRRDLHIRLAIFEAKLALVATERAESVRYYERQELLANAERAALDAEIRAFHGLSPAHTYDADTGEIHPPTGAQQP